MAPRLRSSCIPSSLTHTSFSAIASEWTCTMRGSLLGRPLTCGTQFRHARCAKGSKRAHITCDITRKRTSKIRRSAFSSKA
eukprot:972114-Pleurochrysis_carterae.AAC.6